MSRGGGDNSFDAAKVAMLAWLDLSPDDLNRFQGEMEAIVGYVDQLAELNVDGIEPTAHAAPRTNVLRDDVAGIDFSRETMLSNAPEVIDGELIRMPQVLPGEGMS